MEDRGKNILPLIHSDNEEMDDQVLFTEPYTDETRNDSYSVDNEFILNSKCTLGRQPMASKASYATPEDAIMRNSLLRADNSSLDLKSSDIQDISKRDFTLDGRRHIPTSPVTSARDLRQIPKHEEASRSNISLDYQDNISFEDQRLCRLIDERLKSLLKHRNSSELEENCLFTEQNDSDLESQNARGSWSEFVTKMATALGITQSMAPSTIEERSYMAPHLLPHCDPAAMELPLDGSIIKTIKDVDKDWRINQRVRYCNTKDLKKYVVTESHAKLYCSPPILDDNIDEGILPTKYKPRQSNFVDKTSATTNACLHKLDSSARLLLKQSSYGALMVSYLDQLQSDDGRQEVTKNLSELFLSMADVSARIAANSVAARRSLYLRDMAFKNKATEKKLLCMSTLGPNIFGGKFFEVLQGSADNLRNAKETQHTRFRTQTSLKRRREPSGERQEEGYPKDRKKIKIESSGTRGRRVFYPYTQKGKSEDNQTRFRKGAGFKPSQQ